MARSPQEVFDSHKEALETGNFEMLAADYAEDAILLTLDAAYVGREAIVRDCFQTMFSQLANPKITFNRTAVKDDTFLLEWTAEADNVSIPHASAVFIIQDGLIQRQGEWFNVVPK